MAKNSGDLTVYNSIDPDTLYKPGSMTFFYVPHSKNLYVQPYPTNHRDMMDEDDLFDDVYQGKSVSPSKRASLSSRGQVLANSKALLGRIGAAGDAICIALWSNPTPELFGNFLAKLYEQYPSFRGIQDKTIIVVPGKAHKLTDMIGGNTDPERAVALKKPRKRRAAAATPLPIETPPQDDTKKYEIGHGYYSLSDLQALRSAVHTKGPAGPGLGDPMSVLCHPDMAKYPELSGYRPVSCGKNTGPTLRPTHPQRWRQAGRDAGLPYTYSYGEGFTFRDWIEFQDVFSSIS